MKLPPKVHLYRAWAWWPLLVVVLLLGWHESVFLVLIYSTYANFASDLATYEGAANRAENGN